MPRNSAGTYTLPSGNPVVAGTTIDASWANDTMNDLANEITNSLSRTGAGGMLAPFRVADGAVTAPGLGFTNETNTGLYRAGTGELWFTVGGVAVAQITANGLLIPSGKRIALPAPVNDADAANKEYVDDLVNPVIQYANYYLGPKSSDPTLNNSGGPLTEGTTYWSTTLDQMRVYNGTTWEPMPSTASLQGQTFSGDGVDTTFTLAAPTGNATNLEVFISGVRQVPTTDYTVSGTTLTFTSAPPSGTDNIYVRFAQLIAMASADSSNISYLPASGSATDVQTRLRAYEASGGSNLIGFLQAGTGAGTRTAQAKMRDVVSVKDFGAVGDGVADDTAAFTAAGSSASTVEVNIPSGVYRLNSNPAPTGDVTWVVDKGASFVGTGRLSYLSAKIVSRGAYRSIESDPTFYNGIYGYLEQNAAETGYGVIGLHGSVQSAGGAGTTGEADIGVAAFGAHNLVGSTGGVWGLYSTVLRASGVNGPTHGMEIDVANFGTKVVLTPNTPGLPGLTSGIWLATGGETTEGVAGGSPGVASVGLAIIQNDSQAVKTAKFNKGILFQNTAIEGADGTGGSNLGIAIAFATGHSMQWYNNFDQVVGEITNSNATWTTTIMRMDFGSGVINFQDRATGVSRFKIGETGVIDFASATVTGSAGTQLGFFTVAVNGTLLKIPIYNP